MMGEDGEGDRRHVNNQPHAQGRPGPQHQQHRKPHEHKRRQNVMLALKSVGLDASDIIKLNAYVVDLPVNMAGYRDARLQFFPQSAPHQPASTLIGVSSLAMEGQMIEVEAIAVTR